MTQHRQGGWGDWRTDTAERLAPLDDRTRAIAVVPAVPEPEGPADLPRPTRWPLYAEHPGIAPASGPVGGGRVRVLVPWIAAAVAVAVVGGGLLAALGDDRPVLVATVAGDPGLGVRPGSEAEPADDERPVGSSRGSDRSPGGAAADDRIEAGPRARATSLVATTRASAPVTAPPNQDLSGERVTYGAANLLDGRPETAWRMPGNGRDTVLTLRLEAPAVVTTVGVVNGYAKTGDAGERSIDWYGANRRVRKVEWFFDDGSRVVQFLGDTREVQTTDIRPRRTSTVRMRIARVSMPGPGSEGRDFTAISEISLAGATVDR